jgi:hypothetical protein
MKTSGGFDARQRLPNVAHAVHIGLAGINDLLQESRAGAVNANAANLPSILNRVAASPKEAAAVQRMADPKGELNQEGRTIAGLDLATNFYVNAGRMDKAKKMAVSLLARAGLDAQKHGAYALDLLRQGKDKEAADIVSRAYDFVPNGSQIKASQGQDGQLHAVTTDADGNERDLGAFNRQHLIKLATGVANGSAYMQQLLEIGTGHLNAKAERGAVGGKGGGGGVRLNDIEKSGTMLQGDLDKNKADYNVAAGHEDAQKAVAQGLLNDKTNQSQGMNERIANQIASDLINVGDRPNPKKPDQGIDFNMNSLTRFRPIKDREGNHDPQNRWGYTDEMGRSWVLGNDMAQYVLSSRAAQRNSVNETNDKVETSTAATDKANAVDRGIKKKWVDERKPALDIERMRTPMENLANPDEMEKHRREENPDALKRLMFGSGKLKSPYAGPEERARNPNARTPISGLPPGPEERERNKRRGIEIDE